MIFQSLRAAAKTDLGRGLALGADGRVTGMLVPAQNVRVTRVEGTVAALTLAKPDYSAPADAPYTAQDVTVTTKAGLKLTGTLTLPKTIPAGGVPAVVTITGSGTEERDESLPGVNGYRPFRQVADTLGRRGIAVLRLDDRGAGGSDIGRRVRTVRPPPISPTTFGPGSRICAPAATSMAIVSRSLGTAKAG